MNTPGVQTWEYLRLESVTAYGTTKYAFNDEMQPALKNKPFPQVMNALGGQGWELVGISTTKDGTAYIFKRPATRAMRPMNGKPAALAPEQSA
jgi:hypothetical protein